MLRICAQDPRVLHQLYDLMMTVLWEDVIRVNDWNDHGRPGCLPRHGRSTRLRRCGLAFRDAVPGMAGYVAAAVGPHEPQQRANLHPHIMLFLVCTVELYTLKRMALDTIDQWMQATVRKVQHNQVADVLHYARLFYPRDSPQQTAVFRHCMGGGLPMGEHHHKMVNAYPTPWTKHTGGAHELPNGDVEMDAVPDDLDALQSNWMQYMQEQVQELEDDDLPQPLKRIEEFLGPEDAPMLPKVVARRNAIALAAMQSALLRAEGFGDTKWGVLRSSPAYRKKPPYRPTVKDGTQRWCTAFAVGVHAHYEACTG